MSSNERKNWIEQKGAFNHWILPEASLNADAPYSTHPPGHSLEATLLDCTLFKDLDDGLYQHILCTHNLSDEDPKKFSSSTPKRLLSSLVHTWDSCPSSNRIAQGVAKCLLASLGETRKYGGVVVPEL